ncbi:ankyrin repeat-containing domain protein [Nemania abortiva]|nr:ankyrin repeat-containing domain protein [Nemania abortiva]
MDLHSAARHGNESAVKLLLQDCKNINTLDRKGQTPLLVAVKNGSEAIVKLLLAEDNTDLNTRDNYGCSPLMYAVKKGRETIAKLLLAKDNIDPNTRDKKGWTTLMFAAGESRNVAIVKLLLDQGADLNATDDDGWTPLMFAAREPRNEEIVKLLLDHGADLNATDKDGCTPLMFAAREPKNKEIVKLLLDNGADQNVRDKDGRTLMMVAAERGSEATVKLLLDQGADLDDTDDDGCTPLIFAATRRTNEGTVKLLLAHGADPNITDNDGWTPLMFAASESRSEAIIALLLGQGADLNVRDRYGRTLLMVAASWGNEAAVKLLLSQGADLNARDSKGRTPLILAAARREKTIVELLLNEKNVDLNAKDHKGRTPLIAAASQKNNQEIVTLLLSRDGVDPNAKDRSGSTPLMVAAREEGNEATIKILLTYDEVDLFAEDEFGDTVLSVMIQRIGAEAALKLLAAYGKETRGRTLLSRAAESGDGIIVDLLLAQDGIDPNARDNDGRTPLWWAVKKGHNGVVKQLIHKDTLTLHMLVAEGNQGSVQLLLDAGYNVNTCDINGITPIQLAIQRKDAGLIQKLLKYNGHAKDIMASEWRNAFGKEKEDIVQLWKGGDEAGRLCFITADELTPQAFTEPERSLFHFADSSLWPEIATADSKAQLKPNKLQVSFPQETHDHAVVVSVSLWFPVELHLSQGGLNSPSWSKSRIAWKIMRPTNPRKGPWRPTVYFSMLPYGWIPDDGIDFFKQFIAYLKEIWLELCRQAEKDLNKSRLDQLRSEGKSPELMHHLAKDAQKCAELRDILDDQVHEAKRFITDYYRRYHADQTPDLEVLNDFERVVSNQIGKLDQTVRDLLQIEFAWASITEARISTKLGQNVMLLTYVSIFYMPLAFCAALWAIPDITDRTTRDPFIITSAIVGLVTLLVAFNLDNIAGSMGKVYQHWRNKILEDMRGDNRWKEKGRKFQDINVSRNTPSEWWLVGYLGYKLMSALGRKKGPQSLPK